MKEYKRLALAAVGLMVSVYLAGVTLNVDNQDVTGHLTWLVICYSLGYLLAFRLKDWVFPKEDTDD